AQFAVDDQDGGELHEGEVVGGPLLPADEQAPKAVEPAVRDLHHPAARRVSGGVAGRWERLRGAGLWRDMRGVPVRAGLLAAGRIVVAPVQAQMPSTLWRGFDNLCVQQVAQFLHGGAVGPREDR